VRNLCKSVLNRLENHKMIEMIPQRRSEVVDDLFISVQPMVFTDQDIHEKTVEMVGDAHPEDGGDISETEQYRIARSIVKKKFGNEELHGLYYQTTIKEIAESVTKFLMDSEKIDDVFDTDENIEREVVKIVKDFNPKNLH